MLRGVFVVSAGGRSSGEVLVAHRCSESRTSNDQEGRGAAVAVSDTFASVVARVSLNAEAARSAWDKSASAR